MTATTPNSATEVTEPPSDETQGSGEGEGTRDSSSAGTDGEATPEPTESAAPEAQEQPVDVVGGSDDLIQDIGAQNETAGNLLTTLDSWAIRIGDFEFSAFDAVLILGVITLVMTGAWLITRLARSGIRKIARLDASQQVLAEKLSTIIIWALAFFIGIDMLGIDLTALAFAGGAFGLAIGFGLQKTFGNLISGILLLLDKSIKPGDVISVTDQAGNEAIGQIRKIGIRAISVITRDQTEHLIPNENLMINQVVNWSYSSRDVRVKAPVGVSYGSDLELVRKLLYQAVEDTPRVLDRPKPRVNLMGFGDSSVDFDIRFWIQDPEEGIANIRSDVYFRMWELFKENDIEIPFPQRDLNLRNNEQIEKLISAMAQRGQE